MVYGHRYVSGSDKVLQLFIDVCGFSDLLKQCGHLLEVCAALDETAGGLGEEDVCEC